MKQSLLRKLVLSTLLLVLIPMVAVSGYFLYQLRVNALSNQDAVSLNLANSVSSQIDQFITGNLNVIKTAAQMDSAKQFNGEAVQKDLMNMGKEVPQFALIFLTDKEGMQIARSDGRAQMDSMSDRDYYKEVMTGKAVVSNVVISKTTGKPAVVIAVPVISGDQVIGMIGGTLDLTEVKSIAGAYSLGTSGFISIMDGEGHILVHKDQKLEEERTDQSQIPYVQKALQGEKGNTNYEGLDISYTAAQTVKWPVVVEQESSEIMAQVKKSLWVSTGMIGLGMVLVIVVSVWSSRKLVQPINQLVREVLEVTKGDLSRQIQVSSNDEIGRLAEKFNEMVQGLRTLLGQTIHVMDNVSGGMQELAASSFETQNGAIEITASMERLAANMGEQKESTDNVLLTTAQMGENTRQIGAAIEDISENAVKSAGIAEKGNQALKQVVRMMESISVTTEQTAKQVVGLSQRSGEIGNIAEVMTGISAQTNLLALNAAIEAARAGEQGKGFAVVADEVRKLAEQSSQSAGEIGELIHSIQAEMKQMVDMINSGADEIRAGHQAIGDFEQTITQLTDSSQALAAQVEEINASIQELSQGTEHVQGQMTGVATTTEELNELANKVAKTTKVQSEHMKEVAETLDGITKLCVSLDESMRKFKLN